MLKISNKNGSPTYYLYVTPTALVFEACYLPLLIYASYILSV